MSPNNIPHFEFEQIYFAQESEATHIMDYLDEHGEPATLDYLADGCWYPGEHEIQNITSKGSSDEFYIKTIDEGLRAVVLSYENGLPYVGLECVSFRDDNGDKLSLPEDWEKSKFMCNDWCYDLYSVDFSAGKSFYVCAGCDEEALNKVVCQVVKKGLNALYYSSGEVDSQYGFIPVSVEEGEDVYVHQDEFQIRKIDFESCLEDTSISFC
jgi:hypothetical protein